MKPNMMNKIQTPFVINQVSQATSLPMETRRRRVRSSGVSIGDGVGVEESKIDDEDVGTDVVN